METRVASASVGVLREDPRKAELRDDDHLAGKQAVDLVERGIERFARPVPGAEVLVHHEEVRVVGGGFRGPFEFRQIVVGQRDVALRDRGS